MGNSLTSHLADNSSVRLDRQDPYLRVQNVMIYVRDQDQSLRFYLELLRFTLVFDIQLPADDRWVVVAPPDGSTSLALTAPHPDAPEYKLIGKFTRTVFVTEDIGAKFEEWSKRGVRFDYPPVTPPWGGMFTQFYDPDGNMFVLVGFDEITREVEEKRRAIARQLEAERRAIQEMEIAKEVQSRLFPQKKPEVRTLDYRGVCIQARQVGGDYYDFLDLGKNRLGLVVGDVSGKGIAAALMMANLQANLRSQCAIAGDQPLRFMQSVNQLFFTSTDVTCYASLFFADYDDNQRRLRYTNCGHLPALLLRGNDDLERLGSTCTVLGLFEEWDCVVNECHLFPGDLLVLYTDGITEALNDAEEEFGESRLVETLRRDRELSSEALLESIIQEVREFSRREQHDDITLIVAKCVK